MDRLAKAERPGVTAADAEFRPNIDTNRFRRKRFQLFLDSLAGRVGNKDRIRLLDVGGARAYWHGVRDLWGHLPLEITIVNIGSAEEDDAPYFLRDGDACQLDYADNSFDIVHSNSVLEHVGGWQDIRRMAGEIRRVAAHYFVQTPNYGFPIEPHFRAPFVHWMPQATLAGMLTRRKLGFCGPCATFDDAMGEVEAIRLLNMRQMRELFPDAAIRRERVMGLTKSLIAIK